MQQNCVQGFCLSDYKMKGATFVGQQTDGLTLFRCVSSGKNCGNSFGPNLTKQAARFGCKALQAPILTIRYTESRQVVCLSMLADIRCPGQVMWNVELTEAKAGWDVEK